MMQRPYQATPEQWADAGAFASDTRACLLELRDRIAALEAAPLQPEPIDEAENDRRFRACLAAIDSATPEQIRALTAPTPVTGLVERVAGTIINGVACDHIEEREEVERG